MDRIEQVQSTSTCIHYLCSQVPVLSLFTISASNQNEHARICTKLREESAKERNSDFCFRNFALLTSLRCKWPKRNTKKILFLWKNPLELVNRSQQLVVHTVTWATSTNVCDDCRVQGSRTIDCHTARMQRKGRWVVSYCSQTFLIKLHIERLSRIMEFRPPPLLKN